MLCIFGIILYNFGNSWNEKSVLSPSSETLDIDILIVPDTNLILFASVVEPLRAANRITGQALYGWRIYSPDGMPIETKSRVSIPVDGPFRP